MSFSCFPLSGSILPSAIQNVLYNTDIDVTAHIALKLSNGVCATPLPSGLVANITYSNNGLLGAGMHVSITGTPTQTVANHHVIINFDTTVLGLLPVPHSVDHCLNITTEAPCIPAGQRVLTPTGYQLVETLKTGDYIVTPDGRSVEITMVSYDIPMVIDCNAPILIPANTFGNNSPVNDIVLSPRHFILIKPNVWDSPNRIINHYKGVKRINLGEAITYYNIITPNYLIDDLVVEGTTVESFGKTFDKQYPGISKYYTFERELKGYTRITMNDILTKREVY